MKSELNNKQLIFTSDKPVVEDKLGTHKHLANLLVQIVKSESDNPLVVGLFGSWGTGKSSIVKMYEEAVKEQNIKNISIDAWMFTSAKERFGAGFLKSLAIELLEKKSASDFVKTIDERKETWETNHNIDKKTRLYLISITLILFGLVALSVFWVGFNDQIKLNLMLFLVGVLVVNGLLEFVLPRIMTTSESRTVDESYNKFEHFKIRFEEILKLTKYATISVVIDNLDRVEPKDALEMIRMLKTFVNEDILHKRRFVLIVPCDEQELIKHINSDLYVDDAHEFLRKFFNVSVLVPELIHEDIVAFTKNELDKVVKSLSHPLDEKDISLVSFVISRASRRSPRQVKILINSFIGFWQSASLANTAGQERGISPLGAVIYICLAYLGKGKQFPSKFSPVFNEFAKENPVLQEFLVSIKSFQQYVSDLEWLYLRKLQISDHERSFPNFVDIYFAITDLDWSTLDNLITEHHSLTDLISRLDLKIREGDGVSKARFMRWVLSLAADKKVLISDIPSPLKADLDDLFLKQPVEWTNMSVMEWMMLIDEGLVEYIIQKPVPQKRVVNLLNSLKEKVEKETPAEYELRFITKLISITKNEYWIDTPQADALISTLDGVIFHRISQKNGKFLKTLIENIHVVYFEGTGVKLADELANLYQNETFEGFVVGDVFSHLQEENKGAYTFAAQWLQRSNLTQKVKLGQISLIFQSVDVLNRLADPLIFKPILLSANQFVELIGNLESFYVNQSRRGKPDDLVYVVCALSSIVRLTKKIGLTQQSKQAINSLRDQVWPHLVGNYTKLLEKDKVTLKKHLDAHGKDLDYLQPSTLAQISQYNELNILGRVRKNESQLELVFTELIDLSHFGKVINFWIENNYKKADGEADEASINTGIDLKPLFRSIQQKAPLASKYEEMFDGLFLLANDLASTSDIHSHMLWLIDMTNWKDKGSIDITIAKMKVLEKIVYIDKDIIEALKKKIALSSIDILEIALSDESRKWLLKYIKS